MLEIASDKSSLRSDANPEYIKETARAYVIKNFLLGSDEVLADSDSLIDAGVIDSTSVLELVEFIEKTFHIDVSDRDLDPENFDSIDRISVFVMGKLSQQTAE